MPAKSIDIAKFYLQFKLSLVTVRLVGNIFDSGVNFVVRTWVSDSSVRVLP